MCWTSTVSYSRIGMCARSHRANKWETVGAANIAKNKEANNIPCFGCDFFFSRFRYFLRRASAFFFLFIQIIRNLILLLFSFNSVGAQEPMKRKRKCTHICRNQRHRRNVMREVEEDEKKSRGDSHFAYNSLCRSSSLPFLFRKSAYVFQLKQ